MVMALCSSGHTRGKARVGAGAFVWLQASTARYLNPNVHVFGNTLPGTARHATGTGGNETTSRRESAAENMLVGRASHLALAAEAELSNVLELLVEAFLLERPTWGAERLSAYLHTLKEDEEPGARRYQTVSG
jgi:hypothetical protein